MDMQTEKQTYMTVFWGLIVLLLAHTGLGGTFNWILTMLGYVGVVNGLSRVSDSRAQMSRICGLLAVLCGLVGVIASLLGGVLSTALVVQGAEIAEAALAALLLAGLSQMICAWPMRIGAACLAASCGAVLVSQSVIARICACVGLVIAAESLYRWTRQKNQEEDK